MLVKVPKPGGNPRSHPRRRTARPTTWETSPRVKEVIDSRPTLSTPQGIIPSPAWRLATIPAENKKRPTKREGIRARKDIQFLVRLPAIDPPPDDGVEYHPLLLKTGLNPSFTYAVNI
jgi:hypothetical protein